MRVTLCEQEITANGRLAECKENCVPFAPYQHYSLSVAVFSESQACQDGVMILVLMLRRTSSSEEVQLSGQIEPGPVCHIPGTNI